MCEMSAENMRSENPAMHSCLSLNCTCTVGHMSYTYLLAYPARSSVCCVRATAAKVAVLQTYYFYFQRKGTFVTIMQL